MWQALSLFFYTQTKLKQKKHKITIFQGWKLALLKIELLCFVDCSLLLSDENLQNVNFTEE